MDFGSTPNRMACGIPNAYINEFAAQFNSYRSMVTC